MQPILDIWPELTLWLQLHVGQAPTALVVAKTKKIVKTSTKLGWPSFAKLSQIRSMPDFQMKARDWVFLEGASVSY